MTKAQCRKSIVAALLGHALERYNVVLYGFFASMLAPIFFPADNELTAMFLSMASFAAGYWFRPIGAVYFGHMGDRHGRKKAFFWSIVLVIFPTLGIGILPGYDLLGIWSPILLILFRLFQGFCAGGEFTGAALFVGEHTEEHRIGFAGSLVAASGFVGVLVGTIVGIVTLLPDMPEWSWRAAFVIGALFTVGAVILRRGMHETPDFEAAQKDHKLVKHPLRNVLARHKKCVLWAIFIGAAGHIFLYSSTVYMNVIYVTVFNMHPLEVMKVNAYFILYWLICTLLMGWIADKVGLKRMMQLAATAIFVSIYPLFLYFHHQGTLMSVYILQLIYIPLCAAFYGPETGLFKKLFPVQDRFSGVGLGVTIGQAALGGMTPAIATSIVELTHNQSLPSFYIMFGAALALIALRFMKSYGNEQ